MPRPRWGSLRNCNAAELESAPRSHAHATNFEPGAEASAQFLLNLCLCALRLHIQVHAEQENRAERNHRRESNERNPAQFSHRETLRSPTLKKRPKPSLSFAV